MLIHRLDLRGLLSFGPEGIDLRLRPLNVLIGPNGSGKSNLLEAIDLLNGAPWSLSGAIGRGGGVHDWIWGGEPKPSAAVIAAVLESAKGSQRLRFELKFAERGQRFEVIEERIATERGFGEHQKPYLFYENAGGRAMLNYRDTAQPNGPRRELRPETIEKNESILCQRIDPDHYPELTYIGSAFARIRLYREWGFGRNTAPRTPQKTDLPNDFLQEDAKNLGLVLNNLRRSPKVKHRLLTALRKLYDSITDFEVIVEGNTVQVFFQEGNIVVPATRLSDGTLRYLCLLAILCHPKPPPLVCIEEPELGLHPDILPVIAELLLEASERGQLIVTTHSEVLVDALGDNPECIVVCEKHAGRTEMRRLQADELETWRR